PQPVPSPAPLSQTVWSGAGPGDYAAKPSPRRPEPGTGSLTGTPAMGTPVPGPMGAPGVVAAPAAARASTGVIDAEPAVRPPRTWLLPAIGLLDQGAAPANGEAIDHSRNMRIIEEKLRSFQIPAQVVATNSGPV